MSVVPWIIGGGVVATYLWNEATKPQTTPPPLSSSGGSAIGATAAPRNASKKDHPDLVSVVGHARSWPGRSLRPH